MQRVHVNRKAVRGLCSCGADNVIAGGASDVRLALSQAQALRPFPTFAGRQMRRTCGPSTMGYLRQCRSGLRRLRMHRAQRQPTQRCQGSCLGARRRAFATIQNATAGLSQEFILPHTPEQNGVVESFIGTLQLECVWQHRFQIFDEAKATIEAWIDHYNECRPHSRLGYLPPSTWRLRQTQRTA
jgi:hypothetical protein